ncbi:hypothetical protein QLG07_12860 [Erwinia sp. V90_4]|uniref:hypothetical protein n=1 Tax=Erwinia sp. V90_4 TaxID=3044239 RepID=UPI00249F76CD|nr:hypothetical protein [Erwinia sp. V90_4]MDI3440352.1 hypothetical protein [Erwinia sp. V90_4]
MYVINSFAYGRTFATAIDRSGIVITEGFDAIVGRNLEEFLSHFSQASGRPLQEVRTEMADLIDKINSILGE